jgi:integrase
LAIESDKARKIEEKDRSVVLTKLAFDTIAADYIKKGTWVNGKRIRSWANYERIIERDLKPRFGSTPLVHISSDDITELLQEIGDRANSAARRAYIVISNIFAYAAENHTRHFKAKDSPMPDVPSPAQASKRDRHLTDAELRLVWQASGGMGWPWCEIIRLLILTGGRLREVAHVPWGELNLAERTWLIPGARTKNGDPHLVPISDSALAIWEGLPVIKNDENLVFPSTVGTALSAISKTKRKLDAKILALMQKEAEEAGGEPTKVVVADWRLHDLRRTASVGMQRRGVPREVIDAALNHRTGAQTGITGVYQVYRYHAEKADAFAKWDALVNSIVTSNGSVVQLRGVA